jgi:hypothetical protein
MQQTWAIICLTWKAALRFRLIWALAVLLVLCVAGLPLIIKDDGTARGLTQILLTYTLSAITAILGLATLWLSCGTLARDVEECQMQVVVTKPIHRWQVWLGKWLGIMGLNAALLALAGGTVYGLVLVRTAKLPLQQQEILRHEVLIGRASAKEEVRDFTPLIEQTFLKEAPQRLTPEQMQDKKLVEGFKAQIREAYKAREQIIRPGFMREWKIKVPASRGFATNHIVSLRVKFMSTQIASGPRPYPTIWEVGKPESPNQVRGTKLLTTDTFHEFPIPANAFEPDGTLTVRMTNPSQNSAALLTPLEDGLEVLYHESGFGLNFARGLAILFCWFGLLTALGLAAASFMSFSMAAFACIGLLIVAMSGGILKEVVKDRTIFTSAHAEEPKGESSFTLVKQVVDTVMISVYAVMLQVIAAVEDYSPVESLSAGRSITWGHLARAYGLMWLVFGGICGGVGIITFTRRELATAQAKV